jgi:hypothetical protein
MNKDFAMLFIFALSASSLTAVVAAQTSNPVPEFTLRYVDNSYNVPPTTTSTIDPYTGEVTTTTIPAYHVKNKTVEVMIKNSGAS